MPKVVSRSAVSSSTDAQPTASSAASLRLVIDKSLTALPKRKTDGAIVVRSQDSDDAKARVFKLNANLGDPLLIERQGGHERQYRIPLPSSTPPPAKSGPFIYLLPGALTQLQGQIPSDAFDGDYGNA
ncbi:uncharacterized protein EV420DRAFT_1503199 [Desarmillaria tabescens]|uniref:STEEP1 domain-containing protein n=1 Tax=Armillaria tabescens TaxID=1929756 RepID=A0AA39NM57_ARMTA|nr:uncharacterized protein EV420DRAFT_1503199 [Desarmillaria tabescens]KAK0468171.1 hypothetical protein EV420DRAFT_1503199 [Desarmillaria tabescens]